MKGCVVLLKVVTQKHLIDLLVALVAAVKRMDYYSNFDTHKQSVARLWC